MPAALLFDLDGTLVDSALDIAAVLTAQSRQRGGPAIPAGQVRPLVSLGAAALVAGALGQWAGEPHSDLAEFRERLAAWSPDPGSIYPGVVDALARLTGRGHAMAVVTNKPERLARKLLEDLDLAASFAAIVGGDTLERAKPDPAPLRHALAQLGHAGQALLIGDSEVDAGAARAANLPFVLFGGGYGAQACAELPVLAEFGDFASLPGLLARLGVSHGEV